MKHHLSGILRSIKKTPVLFLLITLVIVALFLVNKKEGFTDYEKNVSYPNVYHDDANKIEKEYVKSKGPLFDYYNNQFYQYQQRDFIMEPELPKSTLTESKTEAILDRIDNILKKIEKKENPPNKRKKIPHDIPSGTVTLKSQNYSKI